ALAKRQERLHLLEADLARLEQNLTHWRADEVAARERIQEAAKEREGLAAKNAVRADRVEELEGELGGLNELIRRDEDETQTCEHRLQQGAQVQAELVVQTELEREALVELASRVANHETNLQNLARTQADLDARHAKNRAEADLLRLEEAG